MTALGRKAGREPPGSTDRPAGSRFSVVVHDGIHVIVFSKSEVLNAFEIERLGHELCSYIEHLERPRVVLDLGAVSHISSTAVGMLITAKTTAELRGGRICLANVRDGLLEIFKVTNIQRMLRVYGTTDAAVDAIGSQGW